MGTELEGKTAGGHYSYLIRATRGRPERRFGKLRALEAQSPQRAMRGVRRRRLRSPNVAPNPASMLKPTPTDAGSGTGALAMEGTTDAVPEKSNPVGPGSTLFRKFAESAGQLL